MEWVESLTVLLSLAAAVLAWVAKIRWSQEYAAAKDEIIRSKDEILQTKEAEIKVLEREIEELRELTPMKVREYFLSMKVQLEEYNDKLQDEKKSLQAELKEKESLIRQLRERGEKDSEEIRQLLDEKKELRARISEAARTIGEVQAASAGSADIYQQVNSWSVATLDQVIKMTDEGKVLWTKPPFGSEEEVKDKDSVEESRD